MRERCIRNTEEEISWKAPFRKKTEKTHYDEINVRGDDLWGWKWQELSPDTMAAFNSKDDILSGSGNTLLVS
jgi:hypothetical protein